MISHNSSFYIDRFECFFNYQISNMSKLIIRIMSKLLVYQLIAEVFWNICIYLIILFGLKYNLN